MGKRLEKIFILAIVLLIQFSYVNTASAGFYDWLISKNNSGILVNFGTVDNPAPSFAKVFAWNDRQPEKPYTPEILPVSSEKEESSKYNVVSTYIVQASGYSSTPDQTDDTPCHTATNYNVCEGDKNVIAANFYVNGYKVPFGTMVRIPELYGDKIFIVEDRMNSRYKNNIDIWFPERDLALKFGRKSVIIEIVNEISQES